MADAKIWNDIILSAKFDTQNSISLQKNFHIYCQILALAHRFDTPLKIL